ncbi:Phosphoglycerate mutase-like protein AT74H [Cyphellophora attinorum]|uniref:Phosphoglycerate mutase-like protein AT74H n=1 Tax=Cyphellophora attinorum TaxID=1664694 RepID=A0A0N1HA47_9EURO|nr:Phosphoglycerate mutase-like protein AT74H [Phialophora attinorum]KPI44735.1 Phosphoglycerate mutase-like protein AT74H [Phialophora attinorum]
MGKPRLILIIRHAQSEGNRDKTIHQTTPDHKVPLTTEAKPKPSPQAPNSANSSATTTPSTSSSAPIAALAKPQKRSRIKVYEEPRLREQDFGNFQPGTDEVERLWRERADYGHFFYRIPNGESGADVYDRITSFNGSLWRRFSEDDMASVAVLVTHGLCSRVFLMAWYHYSVEFFEDLRNINHCEFLVMKLANNGRYVLQNQLRQWSDLRRERASRRSITAAETASEVPQVPVRRWQSKHRHDASGSTFKPRQPPQRQSTRDMFRNDSESDSESGDDVDPMSHAAVSSKADAATETTDGPSSSTTSTLAPKKSTSRPKLKAYLGRDGGGSKSGMASPLNGSDSESAAPISVPMSLTNTTSASHPTFSSSLARALRGEFDDPNRVLADALGDQSDAEVDEVDREVGTKAREESEQREILEGERRERRGSGW